MTTEQPNDSQENELLAMRRKLFETDAEIDAAIRLLLDEPNSASYMGLLNWARTIAMQFKDGEARKDGTAFDRTVEDCFLGMAEIIDEARRITGEGPSERSDTPAPHKVCYILQGTHPTTPGRVLKVFGTIAAAEVEAKSVVEIILEAVEEPPLAEGETADQGVIRAQRRYLIETGIDADDLDAEFAKDEEYLQRMLGEDSFDVWIQEEVIG